METRVGHWLFVFFSEWIWLFILTSIQGGTKAEVRCFPSCQPPLISAFPRELSALDASSFGDSETDEFVGYIEDGPGSKRTGEEGETRNTADINEESSCEVQGDLGGNKCLRKDVANGQEKLSRPEVDSPSRSSASVPSRSDSNSTENSNNDGETNRFYAENGTGDDMTENEDKVIAAWNQRRTRSTESAETWSEFRAEGGEDAAFLDPEEFQLTHTTFALTGDTAHNQAMVHWSGQNSSVSY